MADHSSSIAACVDITGSNRPMDVVVMDDHGKVEHLSARGEDRLLKIVAEYHPRIVAIDGPSGENKRRTRDNHIRKQFGWVHKFSRRRDPDGNAMPLYGNMRLCEALLIARGIKAYSTPPDKTKAAAWIQRGWRVYSRLGELGYKLWTSEGPVRISDVPAVIEVHPHASFVVGLGWIPVPKDSIGGQLERIAYLLDSLTWQGHPLSGTCLPSPETLQNLCQCLQNATWKSIRKSGIKIPAPTHDLIDCLGGLATALSCLAGNAYALGDPWKV